MIIFRKLPIRFIRGYTERKQEQEMKKQKEQFKIYMEELSKKDLYTLKDFKKDILSQDQKQRSFIRKLFTEAQPEEIQMEKQKKILSAFKDDELMGTGKVSGEAKAEIAQVSQTTSTEINELLRYFKMQSKMHSYLKQRRESGEYIPQTKEELDAMMRTDRPVATKEDKYEHQRKYSRNQKKWIGSLR
jgi:signal recognition particle GTPase